MALLNQKTLSKPISFNGIGLHSGKSVTLTVNPSEPDTGIVFKRIDLKNNNLIYPNFLNVTNTSLNTTISNETGVKVSTIEHLMGALFIAGIDNALIEIDNEEVPILDGSAKEFIDEILKIELIKSSNPIKIIKINNKVELKDGNKHICIEPSKLSLDIQFELKYKNPIIGNQKNKINVYSDNLLDVLTSRTFCLYEDIELIKKKWFS
jgi:UDP-3-O-[3-hydroxymyristoyl] N-acetylglucosamine deacetylase